MTGKGPMASQGLTALVPASTELRATRQTLHPVDATRTPRAEEGLQSWVMS